MKTKKHNLLCNFASLFLTSNLMQFGKVNLLFVRKHLGRNFLNHFINKILIQIMFIATLI